MFSLSLASEVDFEELRQFRTRVFQGELGIQDDRYQDVFNDYFSKNILLRNESKLVGAVRLAFSRETQNFYISYLAVESSQRKLSHARLLLGAILYMMRRNGIRLIYGDATDENLPMYLSVGCKPVSQKFYKYGFNCEWTRIEYTLGANRFEDHLVEQVMPFLQNEDLRWQYTPRIVVCSDMDEYRERLKVLIHTKKIYGFIPHCDSGGDGSPGITRRKFVGPAQFIRANNGSIPPSKTYYEEGFNFYNEKFDSRNLIVVGQDSPLLELAKTYGMLSGKRVVAVEEWGGFALPDEPPPSTLLLFLREDEIAKAINSLKHTLDKVKWGIASGDSVEAVSRLTLKNYLQFIGPISGRDVIVSQDGRVVDERASGETAPPSDFPQEDDKPPIRILVKAARQASAMSGSAPEESDIACARLVCVLTNEDSLSGFQNGSSNHWSLLDGPASHLVIGRCNEGSEQEQGLFFLSLIRQGFSVGEAVWVLNRAFARGRESDKAYWLFGDPSLRYFPQRRAEQSFSYTNESRPVEISLLDSGGRKPDVFCVQVTSPKLASALTERGGRFESDEHGVRCAHYVEGDTVHLFAFGSGPLPQAIRLNLKHEGGVDVRAL